MTSVSIRMVENKPGSSVLLPGPSNQDFRNTCQLSQKHGISGIDPMPTPLPDSHLSRLSATITPFSFFPSSFPFRLLIPWRGTAEVKSSELYLYRRTPHVRMVLGGLVVSISMSIQSYGALPVLAEVYSCSDSL